MKRKDEKKKRNGLIRKRWRGGGVVGRMKTKMRAEKEDKTEWGGRLCDKEGQ